MSKRKSIVRQATERLLSMAAFGDSKHADKIANDGEIGSLTTGTK